MLKVPLWAEGFYCVFSKTGDVMFGEVGALGWKISDLDPATDQSLPSAPFL